MEWRLYNLQFLLSREIRGSAKQSVLLKLAYYQDARSIFSGIVRKFTPIWLVAAFEILSPFALVDEACDCSVLCTNPVIWYECTWD